MVVLVRGEKRWRSMIVTGERPAPILMRPGDIIGMKRAEDLSGRDARTIKRWCVKHGIGHNSCRGANWEISAPALLMVKHGDSVALELLRSGQREDPRVRRVFEHLGISP